MDTKPQSLKKRFYVFSFTFLGFLLQILIHGILEQWYIGLLVKDFKKFGLGMTWDQWFFVHHALTVVLLLAGLFFGFRQGRFWWKKIYEKDN